MRAALVLIAVAACSDDGNPEVLWLGPAANGQSLVLVDAEPFEY